MRPAGRYTALVLAADRGDPADPLAPFSEHGNKCLIEIAGRPMIAWVIEALLSAPEIADVLISTDDQRLLERLPEFAAERTSGRLRCVAAGPNLFASVELALHGGSTSRCPAIVTTADNPLLTPAMLAHFCRTVEVAAVDAAIAMTRAEVMRAEHPDGQRRFYAFRDGEFSNCNLYAVVTDDAIAAAAMFRGGGQFRKKTIRVIRAFGLTSFLLYRLGRLSLDGVARRLSRLFGSRIGFVEMPFAEACIDVDNERTLRIARAILARRVYAAEGGCSPRARARE